MIFRMSKHRRRKAVVNVVRTHTKIIQFLVLLAFVVVMVITSFSAKKDANDAKAGQAAVLGSLEKANTRIQQLGGTPVSTPSKDLQTSIPTKTVTLSPVPGPAGPAGPSASIAETAAAIKTVCSSNPSLCQQPVKLSSLVTAVSTCFRSQLCPRPANGKDAPPMTLKEIVNGYATYCGQQVDKCSGPPGINGTNGINGVDGSPGKDGVDGKDGKDGKDGVDAPTIVGISCSGVFAAGTTFVYTFSNGSVISVTCTAPSETPTPTPTQ
jgi:hypothetical protein